jgi:SAM-dependent methyltransferase
MFKVNLGCGHNHMPVEDGWTNLDSSPLVGAQVVADLTQPLPFLSDSCDEFYMSHVLEHIQYPLPLLQEIHRCAKPGAKLTIRVPYGSSDIAFEDPTHYRQYFLNSFMYFSQPAYARADYGYRGDWDVTRRVLVIASHINKDDLPNSPEEFMQMVSTYRNLIEEFIVELTCIKPIRDTKAVLAQAPVEFTFSGALPNG